MRVIYSLSLAAVGMVAASAPASIIVNGDFETGGLSPWVQDTANSGLSNWQVVSEHAHTGSFSARVQSNNSLTQTLAWNPLGADVTEFSFWVRSDTVTLVQINYTDATWDSAYVVGTADTWVFTDATAAIDLTRTIDSITFWGAGGSPVDPTIYIDDVKLTAVPEPATMAVLALGAAALMRRRRAG